VLVTFVTEKIPEQKQLKGLLWLLVSEVSVHGRQTPLFLGRGEAVQCGREDTVEESCLLHGSRKAEIDTVTGEGQEQDVYSKAHPQCPTSPSGPLPTVSTTTQL
jgi:hypothetical protein